MGKIDKTKKNIKVDSLSDSARKELLNKFIEAGGQITEEESEDIEKILKTYKTTIFDRDKQAAYRELIESLKKDQVKEKHVHTVQSIKKKQKKIKRSVPGESKQNLFISFSQKIIIRMRLFFMGVTDFSTDNFNNKFFYTFNTEYKTAFLRLRMQYLELLKQNKNIGNKIIYELDKLSPIHALLIEKTSLLYNEEEINNIMKEYMNSPQEIQPIDNIKEQFSLLFRKIYLLKPYYQNILTAFNKAIEIHMKLSSKKSSAYNTKKKNLKDDLYMIFEKLFPALYWLFCKYNNRIIPLGTFEIEELLNINDLKGKEKIRISSQRYGTRRYEDAGREINETTDENIDNSSEQGAQELPADIKAGLELLAHFNKNNINKLRNLYDKSKTFSHINNTDKILLIYFIFQEFDIEYSFLLTTSKMKYKYGYTSPGNINFKEKLLDYYDDIKKSMDIFKEYSNSVEILRKLKDEKPLTNDRYIAYIKDINALEKKKEQTGNIVRFSILTLMNNISATFRTLIDDIKNARKIIDNPDEIINLEMPIDTDKKLNNKTIFEALTTTYYFTNAFAYRMSTEADLGGSLEFDESERDSESVNAEKTSSPDMNKSYDAPNESIPVKENEQENTVEKSIIDEIDDIVSD